MKDLPKFWSGYNIEQRGDDFTVEGVWEDGKEHPLYRVGDLFEVNKEGWLVKVKED